MTGDPDLARLVAALRGAGCVFAEEEAALLVEAADTLEQREALLARRVAGEPLEHLLGWAEFAGRRVLVGPGTFVPRRRSELLVAEAVARAPREPVVVDLCCGVGALGAAVADRCPGTELYAVDVDRAAVAHARRNVAPLGGRVACGDLYAPLPTDLRGRVDVLLANVPYVPTEAIALMPPEARLHEPAVALDGGADGLDVMRRVAAAAATWLAPAGCLLVEVGERQVAAVARLFQRSGLHPEPVRDEDLGATAMVGVRPPG